MTLMILMINSHQTQFKGQSEQIVWKLWYGKKKSYGPAVFYCTKDDYGHIKKKTNITGSSKFSIQDEISW